MTVHASMCVQAFYTPASMLAIIYIYIYICICIYIINVNALIMNLAHTYINGSGCVGIDVIGSYGIIKEPDSLAFYNKFWLQNITSPQIQCVRVCIRIHVLNCMQYENWYRSPGLWRRYI